MKAKTTLVAVIIGVCLVLIAAGSYVIYLDHKLETLVNTPGVELEMKRFVLADSVKTKPLDLGYARVSIPAHLTGELVRMASSNYLGLVSEGRALLVFCPPVSSSAPDCAKILRMTAALSGESINSWFEYNKLVLAQRPFTIWQIPVIGLRRAKIRAALLLFKALDSSPQTTSIRELETDRMGLVVKTETAETRILIADLRSGVWQEIIVRPSVGNVDETISAMVRDYEFHLNKDDLSSVGHLIDRVGLRTVNSFETPNGEPKGKNEPKASEPVAPTPP